MKLFDLYKPDYDTHSVRETLEHATKPKLSQTKLFSMEPMGYNGSVYEDPRGYGILRVAGILAVVLGIVVIIVVGNALGSAYARSQSPEAVQILNDQSAQDVPVISQYMYWNDGDIINVLSENHTVYEYNSNGSGIACVGASPEISQDTIGSIYLQGLNNVPIEQLVQVLQTGWFLSTGHNDGNNIKVKYADFYSHGEVPAINNAIERQGLAGTDVLATGVDDNENTYTYGSVYLEAQGKTFYWLVAACPISEVYSARGLPNDGVYVGVTIADYELMIIEDTETEEESA